MNRYVYQAMCTFTSYNGQSYHTGQVISYEEFKELPYFEQEFFTPLDKRTYEQD